MASSTSPARTTRPTRQTRRACALFSFVVGLVALAASCRAATEITLVVSTDVKCTDLRGSSVTVGHLGEIETKAATTTSTFCDASGNLGTLVVIPSGGNGDDVAMKIVAGLGRDAESCLPPYGKGCIVARRAVRYMPHTGLRIAVRLRAACDGVPCGETETCVAGACAAATIADPGACSGPAGCDEGALGPASPAADGGVDAPADASADTGADGAPIVAPTYADMTSPSSWSTFDMRSANAALNGFDGAAFDGRYVYFVPNGPAYAGLVARYDTQAPFGTTASWTTFDTATTNPKARGFMGATFDGRYVYFVPYFNGTTYDGVVARYDTQAPFATGASWTTFDTAAVGATAFRGAAFDGRYVYLVPYESGVVARYDTQSPFATGASWSTFDIATVSAGARGFWGAVFDGRYVYFVPSMNVATYSVIARYDTQAPFPGGASWSTFDVATVNAGAKGFVGAAFDGRYVSFVPYSLGPSMDGIVAHYDTQAPFAAGASWSTFDIATVNAGAKGFVGAAFDGRNVYFVPFGNGGSSGLVARYDTQTAFAAGGSWSTFDTTTVNATAKAFSGAAFDGRYLYFVPSAGGVVARFDAKTPPSMPKLPGFSGSFL